jgi:hypothetical protein
MQLNDLFLLEKHFWFPVVLSIPIEEIIKSTSWWHLSTFSLSTWTTSSNAGILRDAFSFTYAWFHKFIIIKNNYFLKQNCISILTRSSYLSFFLLLFLHTTHQKGKTEREWKKKKKKRKKRRRWYKVTSIC